MDNSIVEEDLSGSKLLYNEQPDEDILVGCIFRNYKRLRTWDIIKRSFENLKCYYLVFKPFNSVDDKNFDGMSHVKKYLWNTNIDTMIITREIMAKRIHFNVMIWSTYDFSKKNDKKTSKYYIHAEEVKTIGDKYRVHDYIIKESKSRFMYMKIDVYIKQ